MTIISFSSQYAPSCRDWRILLFLSVCLFWPLSGCAQDSALLLPHPDQIPTLRDDLDRQSLISAATRHLNYLKTLPSATEMNIRGERYSQQHLLESMESFLAILQQKPSPEEFDRQVRKNFDLYQAGGRSKDEKGEMLITGYYEPILEGNLTKGGDFVHPLYSRPESLISYKNPITGKNEIGRHNEEGEKIPFWTRSEIEVGNLLAGRELVYLRDPVDAFVLHVQGSGKICLPDGTHRSLQFAATNGREYKSIGKLLVDDNKMSREEATMPAIRDYLRHHPDEQQRILHYNPRFVFFQWKNKNESPTGSMGVPLTPGRSIAVDSKTLPTGVMAYLVSKKPVLDDKGQVQKWETMQRFVLPQDTGSAIKGAGRADLFWGNGHYAEIAAGNMKEGGQLYFLVKKEKKNARTDRIALATQLTGLP